MFSFPLLECLCWNFILLLVLRSISYYLPCWFRSIRSILRFKICSLELERCDRCECLAWELGEDWIDLILNGLNFIFMIYFINI